MFTKKILKSALIAVALGVGSGAAFAESFPDKPIRIIAPSSPGGILDLTSRLVADNLSKKLDNHPVIVENMPGAGGIIGIQGMLKAKPDGHVLVMGSLGPNAANYTLYNNLPYKHEDFSPVVNVISMPSVLIVNPNVEATNMEEFKQFAEAKKGDASMAISTMGASGHLIGEMMKDQMGVSAINVVYKGAAPAMTDLVAGHVDFMVDNMITALPMIKAGKVKPIAVFSPERTSLLPEVPTVSEQGYESLTGGTWIGLLVSSEVPAERVEQLNKALNDVLADSEVQATLIRNGGEPVGGSAKDFDDFIKNETVRWKGVIESAGISVN